MGKTFELITELLLDQWSNIYSWWKDHCIDSVDYAI
jgi:hypothetical protein